MAAKDKTQAPEETSQETQAPAQTEQPKKVASANINVVELKQGQALVSLATNEDENNYFITSLSDWTAKFSKLKNADGSAKYKLIQEKKN